MKADQPGVALPLSQGLLEHAQSVWIESCTHTRVSGLHRDVAHVLTLMGLSHTIEQVTEDRLFSVDIALIGEPRHLATYPPTVHVSVNLFAVPTNFQGQFTALIPQSMSVLHMIS